jgi:ribosomal protein S27E
MEASEARHSFLMNISCQSCGSTRTVALESRRCPDGTRRVRRSCRDCSHRWTIRQTDDKPVLGCIACDSIETIVLESRALKDGRRRRRLQCSDCTNRWTIWIEPDGSISQAPSKVQPTIHRSCHDCANWRQDRCWFRFPDPIEEGPGFAADCLQFRQREDL